MKIFIVQREKKEERKREKRNDFLNVFKKQLFTISTFYLSRMLIQKRNVNLNIKFQLKQLNLILNDKQIIKTVKYESI